MSASSFRTFIDVLERSGAITRITDDVSWDLEASAITMMAIETDDRIPVFESVQNRQSDTDARLVGDPYRGPQQRPWKWFSRAFDLPGGSGPAYYEGVIDRLREPIEPRIIPDTEAPCKEVIRTDDDASLLEFPWPYIHQGDGGRYATLTTLVAPDPDSEWGSWSRHRAMIHGASRASLLLLAGEQVPNHYYFNYELDDEPMPVALTIGAGPAVESTAEMWIPVGRSEVSFAGGLQESPVDLVRCETNDLAVPASAEVVIEGRVLPNERLHEGPFGDYFGYMNGPRRSMPILEVDAITHRSDPYVPFCVEGAGIGYGENSSSTFAVAASGPDATLGLRIAGFDVELAAPWPFTSRTVWVIAVDPAYPGVLHELANFIFTTWGMLHIDFFVFVDSDVNPLSPRAVIEAISLHADPSSDFHQFGVERMPKVPLNIYQTPDEKGSATVGTSKTKTSKAYIDACAGSDRPAQVVGDPDARKQARELLVEAGVPEAAFEPPNTIGGDR
ncbi:UbiD family decarboxylase [Natronococcus sp. A-GB1]|uniref:UbiD family decarboxylase n=1 Tax=Natronococcus sp. A-GB1 TaxID=3037648 RepID=UPI00241D002B|nr:UbiD family decarboxylase [Natronococcus sp. A-GB1]MDG5758299.1 UbiD family decarboxylase [Natronococcus sp. A-GB1]